MPCLDFSQPDELMRPFPVLHWPDCSSWLKLSGDPSCSSSFHELKKKSGTIIPHLLRKKKSKPNDAKDLVPDTWKRRKLSSPS